MIIKMGREMKYFYKREDSGFCEHLTNNELCNRSTKFLISPNYNHVWLCRAHLPTHLTQWKQPTTKQITNDLIYYLPTELARCSELLARSYAFYVARQDEKALALLIKINNVLTMIATHSNFMRALKRANKTQHFYALRKTTAKIILNMRKFESEKS